MMSEQSKMLKKDAVQAIREVAANNYAYTAAFVDKMKDGTFRFKCTDWALPVNRPAAQAIVQQVNADLTKAGVAVNNVYFKLCTAGWSLEQYEALIVEFDCAVE